MGRRMRAFDWASTPLGPAERWPQSLKTIVRVMLDSRFAMWLAWGPDLRFLCNDAYLPTVGLKHQWVLGSRADQVWHEIWADIGPRIQHVLTTGKATWDEGLQLFLQRSGYQEETFHTFSYSPVYDDADHTAGMLCVVVEDTDRVLSERRLKLLRELASVETGAAPGLEEAGGQMLQALSRGVQDVPFAALYLCPSGSRRAELAGTTLQAADPKIPRSCDLDGPGADPQDPVVQALLARQDVFVRDIAPTMGRIPGAWSERVHEALAIPLAGPGTSRPIGVLVLGVSTRRRLDESYRSFLSLVAGQFASQLADAQARLAAQRRAEALAALDRAKNLFFSNVSHELRTPLTLMLGPVQTLLGQPDPLPPQAVSLLQLVQRNGLRLRKLVNTLLDFSRIEAGQVQPQRAWVELGAFTADLTSVFRAAVEEAGLRLIVRCPALPRPVQVDPEMWEKIVLNLLSNAFKFTFQGEIEVALAALPGRIRLTVRDTGAGIPAQSLPRVFERFHRVEGMASRSQEGTGIGLALVKELVRLHEGSIEVSSEPGQGTLFTVEIPEILDAGPATQAARPVVRRAAEAADFWDEALDRDPLPPPPDPNPAGPVAAQERPHILVVDDNADMRAYLQRLLAPHWQVSTASDGMEALAAIRHCAPDLVITDMMMPRLDGTALLRELRQDPALRALPVVVLSARAGEEARVAGLQLGADDYLVKPFSAAELLARIEVQLMRVRMRRVEQDRHQRLVDVFRHAPVGVAMSTGPDHVFQFVNDHYRQFVGGRDVVGRSLLQALPELQGQGVKELLDQVQASGRPRVGRAFPVQLRDGADGRLRQRYFEFVMQPLSAEGGQPDGIVTVGVDVTEQHLARTAAEAASRTKDEFIAILGHELRNPLAPIVTALHLLKLRDDPTTVHERQIIERQVQHMARLVDDLLDVSRITRGQLSLQRRPIEMAEAVDRAVETAAPLLERKRHRLKVQVPRRGLTVWADELRLCQVISNLLANAAHYTEDGGRIELVAQQVQGEVRLTVKDNGIGMDAAELASVFELFVQGAQGMDRPRGGLGLGLTIALSLAVMHGGQLSAHSEGHGKGSEFQLTLPLAADAAVPAPLPAPAGQPSHGQRVLIVDDNADAATALSTLLRISGHSVWVAHDGPCALELLGSTEVDVALLDIGLPEMDGYELATRIARDPRTAQVRLIALTGYGQAKDIERSREAGFSRHLVKPVMPETLIRAVEGAADLPG